MKDVERTITVPVPLSTVWEYLTDFTHTEQWDPPTEHTELVLSQGTDGKGEGTVYRNTSSMLGSSQEVTYTVTEYVPQQRFQLRGDAGSIKLLDTITFAGDETTTTVTYHAEFHPEGVAKLAEPLLPLGLKLIGDKTADQLETTLRSLDSSPA